ncbi:MAG: hypothetical protein QOH24_2385, partial [Verrucomicrobiota bacterium]
MPHEILADFPHRAGELATLRQDVVERGDEEIDLAFADDQRRQNFDNVHGVPGHLGQNPMLAQHLSDDHLREKDFVDFVKEFPRHLQFELGRLVELDPDNEAFPAHFLDEGMFGAQCINAFRQERAHSFRIFNQLFLIEDIEGGQAASHGEIVPAEGRRMDNATVHSTERFLVNLAPGHNRAARDVTAAQAFRQGDDVWLQVPMLEAEHFPRAAKSGLDFVANQQRAVPPAKFLGAFKEIRFRRLTA